VVATVDERLAPGATASGLREVIGDLGATVVVVGHQPDCSEILVALGGEDRPFAPGAAAVIEL
jgi:phosphohistidine phosphatase SixA